MKINVSRQLVNKHNGALQVIAVLGEGSTAQHAFDNAVSQLDAIEARFNAVELYKTNKQLIERHDAGDALNEADLEKVKNQILEFETAEAGYQKPAGKKTATKKPAAKKTARKK